MKTGDDIAVTHRHKDLQRTGDIVIDEPPFNSLPDLKGGRLFPFDGEGIKAGIAAVPAEDLCSLDGEIKSSIIIAIDQNYLCPVHQELCDLCRRCRTRRENDGFLSDCGCHTSQCCTCIACRCR